VAVSLPQRSGLLVVGHGTADPVGAAETRRVADLVAMLLPGVPVAVGFLEVIRPSIDDGLAQLATAGCSEVVATPLLLFAAGHAKRDVPEAIESAAAAHGLAVRQTEPFGCHPAIAELSRRRRQEAVAGLCLLTAAETTVVMIGRGSSDPTALSQLKGFAAATFASEPEPREIGFGFVAAARPTLREALDAATDPSRSRVRRILVQPHLLFRGHVEEQVNAAVQEARSRHPGFEWIQTSRLGAHQLVATAVVARVQCGHFRRKLLEPV
jgi:sirohydrochlorin cobaltochelatase